MIKVLDNYVIDVSEPCYVVGKLATTTNKKTGETTEYIASPKYVSTFDAALKCVRRSLRLEGVKQFDGTLEEAISALMEIDRRFDEAISGLKGA